jgi:V8-like Glu-specific endopeptidase
MHGDETGEQPALNERIIRMLGNLDSVQSQVKHLQMSFDSARERAIILSEGLQLPEERQLSLSEQYLEHGLRAVQKLQQDGPGARLTKQEQFGIEAVVHTLGRPALLIKNGHFEEPPEKWSVLDTKRANIEKIVGSVGKIEKLIDGDQTLLGTGFLVAKNIIMTNRHVLELFGVKGEKRWILQLPAEPRIDYDGEYETSATRDFALLDVIAVDDHFDLALVRVAPQSPFGFSPPDPLPLSSGAPEHRNLYVVGYPAIDAYHETPSDVIQSIFAEIFEVKRLQPGELLGILEDEKEFAHDCSTLGGNSGSCVVDFESSRVVGLHYRGTYLQSNFGIALWKLQDNASVRKAGLTFE